VNSVAGSKHANKNSFKKGNTAARNKGINFRTKLLNTIREQSLIGASPDLDNKETEALFLGHFADRALDKTDPNSATLLQVLVNKSYMNVKSTLPSISFDFDENMTLADQARAVMKATAEGVIPPDVAQILINSIASTAKIEEVTELQGRIELIENALGSNNA
jgi:hypothetical protein